MLNTAKRTRIDIEGRRCQLDQVSRLCTFQAFPPSYLTSAAINFLFKKVGGAAPAESAVIDICGS